MRGGLVKDMSTVDMLFSIGVLYVHTLYVTGGGAGSGRGRDATAESNRAPIRLRMLNGLVKDMLTVERYTCFSVY